MDEESPLPILASCSWVQNDSSLKSHLGKDYACGMRSSFKVSLPMKSLYFTKHRHAVAQVNVRKGHLYNRLLKNIIRLGVFNSIFIERKIKFQVSEGPRSYFIRLHNLLQRSFVEIAEIFSTVFLRFFLDCIFILEQIFERRKSQVWN